jgi:hypothetical protein
VAIVRLDFTKAIGGTVMSGRFMKGGECADVSCLTGIFDGEASREAYKVASVHSRRSDNQTTPRRYRADRDSQVTSRLHQSPLYFPMFIIQVSLLHLDYLVFLYFFHFDSGCSGQ